MPVTVVQPGFVNGGGGGGGGGAKRGSEVTEREMGVGGGVSLSHGREIFENSCMKTAFSCTLNSIIKGKSAL